MNSKRISYVAISIFIALFSGVFLSAIGLTINNEKIQGLSFKAKANKEVYVLGEPIKVDFEFINQSDNSMIIPSRGVEVGSLKVFIADQGGEYKEYFASGWGRLRGARKTLEPKQSHKYEATILWNGVPRVSHLNESAAKRVLEGKITTEYALPEPGAYFIKGVSTFGENMTKIESEPVQVVINEPVGDDLKVWNRIKGNREIAYLLQKDSFDTDKDEEKTKLIREVEQIVQTYPNSVYSDYLKPKLEKFKANEERRSGFYKNMKTQQKPE